MFINIHHPAQIPPKRRRKRNCSISCNVALLRQRLAGKGHALAEGPTMAWDINASLRANHGGTPVEIKHKGRVKMNTFWDNEDLQESILRSSVALLESKVHKYSKHPDLHPAVRVTQEEIRQLKTFGLFFPAKDRLIWTDTFDTNIDGLVTKGAITTIKNPKPHSPHYLYHGFTKATRDLHPLVRPRVNGIHYTTITYSPGVTTKNGVLISKHYATLTPYGNFVDCDLKDPYSKAVLNSTMFAQMFDEATPTLMTASSLNFYTDKKYCWLVEVQQPEGKITFGCYSDEVKSLFYARDLPLTEAGRKRPILHWVASHNRRMKSGVEVEIEKHLRGVTTFRMDDTIFQITQPIKQITSAV